MDTILSLIRDRNYTQVVRQCRELETTVPHHSPFLTYPGPHHQPYSRFLLRFHHVAPFPERIVPPKALSYLISQTERKSSILPRASDGKRYADD